MDPPSFTSTEATSSTSVLLNPRFDNENPLIQAPRLHPHGHYTKCKNPPSSLY